MARKKQQLQPDSLPEACLPYQNGRYQFNFKNHYQEVAWQAIDNNAITILLGEAGCGKTTIATAYAVNYILKGRARKLFLTRPHVLTERIGFIPGDVNEKLCPLIRPITDALDVICPSGQDRKRTEAAISVESIAYLRGATLTGIGLLDEAQNLPMEMLKLYISRLGQPPRSKLILTADPFQSDIPNSGILQLCKYIGEIEGVAVVHLPPQSQCRNPLISKLMAAIPKVIN
jgi:phosphate starvation-inducible PhoH-like protein